MYIYIGVEPRSFPQQAIARPPIYPTASQVCFTPFSTAITYSGFGVCILKKEWQIIPAEDDMDMYERSSF